MPASEKMAGVEIGSEMRRRFASANVSALLEHRPQKMRRRRVRHLPDAPPVHGPVENVEADRFAHRSLVERRREAPRRHGRQHARIAGPCKRDERPGRPCDPRRNDVPAEPWRAPIENANQPRAAVIWRRRHAAGAGPFVVDGKEIGARPRQALGDGVDLGQMGVVPFLEPPARNLVELAQRRRGKRPGRKVEQRMCAGFVCLERFDGERRARVLHRDRLKLRPRNAVDDIKHARSSLRQRFPAWSEGTARRLTRGRGGTLADDLRAAK